MRERYSARYVYVVARKGFKVVNGISSTTEDKFKVELEVLFLSLRLRYILETSNETMFVKNIKILNLMAVNIGKLFLCRVHAIGQGLIWAKVRQGPD